MAASRQHRRVLSSSKVSISTAGHVQYVRQYVEGFRTPSDAWYTFATHESTSQTAFHRFIRFCSAHGHYQQTAQTVSYTVCSRLSTAELDLSRVHLGLGWTGLGFRKWTHVQLWSPVGTTSDHVHVV